MPTPSTSDRIRVDHADALFVVAQLASPDGRTAAQHVAAVIEATDLSVAADADEERRMLVRALLDRVAERSDLSADAPSSAARTQLSRLVSGRLPVVLSGMSAPDRVLVGMRFVQQLSQAQAAEQLGTIESRVAEREQHVLDNLRDALLSGAAPYELEALGAHLTGDALGAAIGRALKDDLQALPPSLRPTQPASPPEAERPSKPPKRSNRMLLAGYLALALAITLLAVYAVTRERFQAVETDAVALAARQAESVELIVETIEPERATQFARDHSGFSFSLPTLARYRLDGVTLHELAPGVSVPAFGFSDDSGDDVVLFTFPYSLLDRAGGRLTLDRDTRIALEASDAIAIHDLRSANALVWRHRDDVFVAVTESDADALRERISW